MSDYSKSTNFTAKDGLSTGDPNKRINGSLFDGEFDPIATAVASKIDKVAGETGELAIFTAAGGLESSDILPSIFDTLALQATSILAGNGITGGGDLSTDRTITLGTPSTVDATTTNSVTSTSHTHEIDIEGSFTGSNQQLANPGFQKFPGGFTVQWGITSSLANHASEAVTFPTAFGSACVAVMATCKRDFISGGTISAHAKSLSTTGATIVNDGDLTNTTAIMWVAIGY